MLALEQAWKQPETYMLDILPTRPSTMAAYNGKDVSLT